MGQEPGSAGTEVAIHGLLAAAMASGNLHWRCGPSANYSKSSADPFVCPGLALDAWSPPRPANSAVHATGNH